MANSIEDLMAKLAATKSQAWQYLEVKQLSEILARHREKLRAAVREYRMHKRTHAAETDPIEKLYLGYEGMFQRDHLRDALRLYVMINHDYHEAYRAYMAALAAPKDIVVTPVVMLDSAKPRVAGTRKGKKAA